MQKLLDQIERDYRHRETEEPLRNSVLWMELRNRIDEVIAYAVEADKVVKLVEASHA